MIETGANRERGLKPADVIDGIYDWFTSEFGQPIGFNLFDKRLCEVIDFSWLRDNVARDGVTEQELREQLDKRILKAFPTRGGSEGFLLYTPEQVKTIRVLKASARYTDEELKHIVDMWNADIDCTVEVLPYDDPEITDFDHLRRRLAEYIGETKRQIAWVERDSTSSEEERQEHLERFKSELEKSERTAQRLDSWNPTGLTDKMRSYVERSLFHLRWVDEWVRIGNAQMFQSKITAGYSPEVFFSRWSHSSAGVTFERIDWLTTLRAFREIRSDGKIFPLRTPDFDLVERGMILRKPLTPEDYGKLCAQYGVGDLSKVLNDMGADLWNPPRRLNTNASCLECGVSFTRTLVTKQYCSDKCRSRAKQRRYRERDPERVRLSQVRYWTSYLEPTE